MIEDYHFGSITIDGTTYSNDVIIRADKIIDWWREEGHNISIDDLKELPDQFEVLVIGNGASGQCNVPQETIDFVEKKGVEVIVQITEEATQTYNKLLEDDKKVVGALHLTC